MSSAISGYINTIQNAVYGEQVRGAIVNALQACYSDVENPDLQSAAFLEAIEEAYENGVLDITEVTQVSAMTNENIIYRYMGTETGYTADTLYFYNGSAWVPIGSGVRTVNNTSLMTDTSAIYKYTGTQTGYIQNALYYHNGTAWIPIADVPTLQTEIQTLQESVDADVQEVQDAVDELEEVAVIKSELESILGHIQNLFAKCVYTSNVTALLGQLTADAVILNGGVQKKNLVLTIIKNVTASQSSEDLTIS